MGASSNGNDDSDDQLLDPFARYLSFMEDEGLVYTCCLDDPNIAESDPEAFDCESCKVRLLREALTDQDQKAIDLYGLLADPVVKDLGLYPMVWAAVGLKGTRSEVVGLLKKLSRFHQHQITMMKLKEDQGHGPKPDDE